MKPKAQKIFNIVCYLTHFIKKSLKKYLIMAIITLFSIFSMISIVVASDNLNSSMPTEETDQEINLQTFYLNPSYSRLKTIINALPNKALPLSMPIQLAILHRRMLAEVVTSSALWLLESNRHQDPIINKKITMLINKSPNLNYQKTLNRRLFI